MSKNISAALKTHLQQSVTTLTTCWLIVRLDGQQFGFTTLDMDLLVSGVTYASATGFSRTAISTTTVNEVDNLEVLGFFDPAGIVAADVRNGKFDYATIYLFAVNWKDLTMGICRLRRGYMGEASISQSGAFRAELRGLSQALVQEFGNIWSPLCRVDLGSPQCGIPIKPANWQPFTAYPAGTFVQALTQTTDATRVAIFQSNGGTSGATEPSWVTTVGSTTTGSGGIVWTSVKPLRLISAVTATNTAHEFTVAPLAYPGNDIGDTAVIGFINNVSAGTVIEISDGANTVAANFIFDTLGSAAFTLVLGLLPGALDVTVTTDALNINITNHSGQQGVITKTGDIANGVRLTQFANAYLDGGTLTWITGQNAGISMEIKTYLTDSQSLFLWLGMKYPIQVGDTFYYYPGCDKRRDTCDQKFSNSINFRGEPDMPGMDQVFAYPDAA